MTIAAQASISDLLADVRRLKAARNNHRAACSGLTRHTVKVYAQRYSVAASGAANASIADLLADVRRLKAAGDSIRAVRSRPVTVVL